MGGAGMIPVVWSGVEVDRLEGALRGLRLGVAPMWAAGRLPPKLDDPTIRQAVSALEELLISAVEQWSRAYRAGTRTFTLRVSIPAATASAVVSLARQVCELMVQPETMAAVGLEAVSPQDAEYALGLLEQVERLIIPRDQG